MRFRPAGLVLALVIAFASSGCTTVAVARWNADQVRAGSVISRANPTAVRDVTLNGHDLVIQPSSTAGIAVVATTGQRP